MNTATLLRTDEPDSRGNTSVDIAVWLIIAVSTCLFTFFALVHTLRMNGEPGVTLRLAQQLWVSTAWLMLSVQLLRMATHAACRDLWPRCRSLWLAGGASTALFVASQLWAWQSLQGTQVLPQGSSTATGLFYLLTGLQGLYVLGGLMAWAAVAPVGDPSATRARIWQLALCVRYWHFLLAVWLVAFTVLAGSTS